jgi:RHS repeat-associated protein
LHGDHLGSSSLTTNAAGSIVSQLRYLPFGGTRWESGSTPTDFQFTGQRKEAGIGLYDYNARYYDPLIGRFVSPDTIVPEAKNPQDLNRYSYTRNNPIRYTDSTGHCLDAGGGGAGIFNCLGGGGMIVVAGGATLFTSLTVQAVNQNGDAVGNAVTSIVPTHQSTNQPAKRPPASQTDKPKIRPQPAPPPPPAKPLGIPQSKNNLLPVGGDSLTPPNNNGSWTEILIYGAAAATGVGLILCSLDQATCNLPNPEELVPALEPKEKSTPIPILNTSCGANYCLESAPTPDPSIPIPVPAPTPFRP